MPLRVRHDGGMQLPKPKSAPGIFLYGLAGLAGAFLVWLFGDLALQNAENLATDKGYDKLLSHHWSEIVAWLAVNQFWLSMAASFLLGGTVCAWAYAALIGRERKTEETVRIAHQIDRDALAKEVETLADEISAVSGEYRAQSILASQRDFDAHRAAMYSNLKAGDPPPMITQDHSTEARAKLLQRFNDKIGSARIFNILLRVQKCISLDRSDIWHFERGIDTHQIEELPKLLSMIAVELRYPGETIPQNNKRMELILKAQAEQQAILSQSGTVQETQQ